MLKIHESVSFWTNGSDFMHQKPFTKNLKFNFPAKIYKVRKKC